MTNLEDAFRSRESPGADCISHVLATHVLQPYITQLFSPVKCASPTPFFGRMKNMGSWVYTVKWLTVHLGRCCAVAVQFAG